jgi:hypothetical protein
VGSRTLGNMLSSGRFAVINVEDVRSGLRRKISAPASLAAEEPHRAPADQPLSPVAEELPSSQTWLPPSPSRSPRPDEPPAAPDVADAGRAEPGVAGTQSAVLPTQPLTDPPAVIPDAQTGAAGVTATEANGSVRAEKQTPAEPVPIPGTRLPMRKYSKMETNATLSGRLLASDLEPAEQGKGRAQDGGQLHRKPSWRGRRRGNQQGRGEAFPSLRLDLAPEGAHEAMVRHDPVLGRVLTPMRSPFASDESSAASSPGPGTPKARPKTVAPPAPAFNSAEPDEDGRPQDAEQDGANQSVVNGLPPQRAYGRCGPANGCMLQDHTASAVMSPVPG